MPTIKARPPVDKMARKKKAMSSLLWDVKIAKMPALETEIRFNPKRLWRIDYGYSELKIGVEFEGGTFGVGKPCPVCKRRQQGRHTSGAGHESDCEKYTEANLMGWIIIRATENSIKNGLTFEHLKRAYEIRALGGEL